MTDANQLLSGAAEPDAPSPGHGEEAGPGSHQERPGPELGVTKPDSPPTGPKSNAEAGQKPDKASLLGLPDEPDASQPPWCPNCEQFVGRDRRGCCAICHRAIAGAYLNRKHPVNKKRREQILDRLIAEYAPTTQRLAALCGQLADVLEQAEARKAGSQEHKRLVELTLSLSDALERSKPATPFPDDYDQLNDDEIIERLEAALTQAKKDRDDRRAASPPPLPPRTVEQSPVEQPSAERSAALAAKLTQLAQCPWCHESIHACAQLKADRPEAWAALHFDDDDEVARRNGEATAEMMESLKRGGKGIPEW
jgi:hypothetical protein